MRSVVQRNIHEFGLKYFHQLISPYQLMNKDYQAINSFNNHDGSRCVDIVKDRAGRYRYQEWRRDSEDQNGWFLLQDSLPLTYLSEVEAIVAAKIAVAWFKAAN